VQIRHGRATVNPAAGWSVRSSAVAPIGTARDARSLKEGIMATPSIPVERDLPVVLPGTRAALWLFGTVALSLLVYYFVGIDQGATSVFGNNTYIHEFVHDARHFLGFPCH